MMAHTGRDDPDHLDSGAGAAARGVLRRRELVRARERRAAGRAVPGAVPDGAGHGRAQVERVRLRVGPVRRDGPRREAADDALLQLVLLLHQPGVAARRHRAGLRPGQPGPAVGVRRLRRLHRARARRLPRRHQEVPVQEARRQPAHPDRRRRRRRLAQPPPRPPVRPLHALRHRRRRQEEPAQAAHPPHRAVPVSNNKLTLS
jgi:hypothetical protein